MYPINRIQVAIILSFILGIVAFERFNFFSLGYSYFFILAIGLSLLFAKAFSFKTIFISFICFLLGSGFLALKMPEPLPCVNENVHLEGKVLKAEGEKPLLFLRVDTLNGEAKKPFNLALKKAYKDEKAYLKGGRYSFSGKLVLPSEKTNLGGFDERAYLKSKGIFYLLKTKEKGEILTLPKGVDFFILKNRAWFHRTVSTYLSKDEAYFLEAVLFGEKGYLDKDFYALAQKVGLAHLFAVSGLHVGFFVLVLLLILKKTRYSHSWLIVFLLAILLLYYTLLVDGVYSVLRASGLIFLTYLLKRCHLYRDLPTLLSWLLVAILIVNPFALYDIGLVLSFSLALGIGLFYPGIRMRLPKRTRYFKKPIIDALTLSVTAELISLPLVAHYFYMITPLSIIYNFLLVPFFGLLVPLAFFACFSAIFFSSIAKIAFFLIHVILKVFFASFEALYSLFSTGHYYVGSPSLYWLLGYLVFLFFFYYVLLKAWHKKEKYLCMGIFLFLLFLLPNAAPKTLRLSVLDVGQGSGATYQLADGRWLVFDTGPSPSTLATHLRYMGVNRIEAIILSHGDKDHVGGLYELLRDFNVKYLFLSDDAYTHSENLAFLREKKVSVNLCFVRSAETIRLGKKTTLSLDLIDKVEGANSHEIVAYLKEHNLTYLFPGDTEGRAIDEVKFPYPVSVLLVPHHGSKNSYSESFYRRYQPQIAIISSGRDNRFHHPHEEVVDGLKNLGISYYQTNQEGALYFYEKNGNLVMKRGF